ncbi:hypothetical protein [Micromonospora humida]|uniref:hypothetical protein n=1 Tax=Micromonospora humida TaxID=2809018 RepID=UPI003431F22E
MHQQRTERTIKARYLRPEHLLVLDADNPVEFDRDTVNVRLAGGGAVIEYDADEAVTVAGAKPAEPATDPRRIAYELVLAGVAAGLPIPDSINIPSNNTVVTLWAADGDRDAVERWAAYLNLPTPADGRPIGVKPDRVFRSYESETSEHPALPGRRVRVTSLCDLSDAEVAELESQLAAGGTR